MQVVHHTQHIIAIRDFWSSERCDALIETSESMGYEPALVQTDKGQVRVEGVRNNQRVLFTDTELAVSIWNEVKQFAPNELGNSKAIGLNEMFRFYKYDPGQEFKKHRDQSFIRDEHEASYYTFMIYLNDDFEGGETSFNDIVVNPSKGMALLFFHDLEHEGRKLISGSKYVLRSDIMFRLEVEH